MSNTMRANRKITGWRKTELVIECTPAQLFALANEVNRDLRSSGEWWQWHMLGYLHSGPIELVGDGMTIVIPAVGSINKMPLIDYGWVECHETPDNRTVAIAWLPHPIKNDAAKSILWVWDKLLDDLIKHNLV